MAVFRHSGGLVGLGLVLGATFGLVGCAKPPPEAFTKTTRAQGGSIAALDIGENTAREACTMQREAGQARIYCGNYVQAAGHVNTEAQATDLTSFVTASPWRTAFDRRFQCGAPLETTMMNNPAVTLACTRRQGGWQHVVIATRIDGTLYVADAVKPAEPVLGRAIGVLANRLPAVLVESTPEASSLATSRAAEQAVNVEGVAAIAEVDRQIERGAKENRQGNYTVAEAAYRAAVTLQERAVGANNPALAVPLARLALQISNQGRFAESGRLFSRATRLAASPGQIDPVAVATVTYLEALDELNRSHPAEALVLLDVARQDFAANIPPEALVPRRAAGRSGVDRIADGATDAALLQSPTGIDALNGLVETQRYRAVALAALNRPDEAKKALVSAKELYVGRDPRLIARYYRTIGMAGTANTADAVSDLGIAVNKFSIVQPDSLPLAQTQLLEASKLGANGDYGGVSSLCRDAARTLRSLKVGADSAQVVPCLHGLSLDAAGSTGSAQSVRDEMFGLSQLAQGGITSRQIALATARLAEGARDPRVGEAIRERDSTNDRLDVLYRKRAELASDTEANQTALTKLDEDIRKARNDRTEAGEALQAAAPGFAALVQETVSARDAQSLLGPKEALVSVVMDQDEGWIFLLRRDRIFIGKLEGGAARINPLVARFRASVEPGRDGVPPHFDTAAAHDIYTSVLGPVSEGLADVESVTLAPYGSLLSIPFGALLTGPASADAFDKAPFLIRRMTVSHVPSVASFVNLRKSAKTAQAPQPWFGMGEFRPPTLHQATVSFPVDVCRQSAKELAFLPPLPGARKELDVARRLLGAGPNDEMLGAAFTAVNVRAAPLNNYRVLHFATHAVLPGELRCLEEPAILTSTPASAADARGGLLTSSQIAQMDLNAELVILAACNSGGPAGAGAGESLSGLARSFFFAGARSLLITHWDANDSSTPYLTALFLGALQADPSAGPSSALATAQRRMLDEAVGKDETLGHPYYWAAVALIGGKGSEAHGSITQAARGRIARQVGG